MTMIKGGPAGPDAAQGDGKYRNEVEFDRAALWDSLGGTQGVLRGFTHTLVAGQLQVSFSAGAGLVEERDASGNLGLQRGYHCWSDVATVVTHGAPSAAARVDAIVLGFADTEDGALGTAVTQVGAQIFIVPGVSGTTTPRTDAQINAGLGRGGWVRLADVRIDPGDTQINPANFTLNAARHANPLLVDRVGQVRHVRKTADESVTSSNVKQDDNELFASVKAGAVYAIELDAQVACADAAVDFRFDFTHPGGTMLTSVLGPSMSATSFDSTVRLFAQTASTSPSSALAVGATSATNFASVRIRAVYVCTADGTLQFRWCQDIVSATAVTVKANSLMRIERIE